MFDFLTSILVKVGIVITATAISIAGFFGITINNEKSVDLAEEVIIIEEKEEIEKDDYLKEKIAESIVVEQISLDEDTTEIANLVKKAEALTKELTDLIKNEVLKTTVEQANKEGTAISIHDLNIKIRPAIVNILCTTKAGGSLKPITGSGIVIDEKGVILTNAHIAQYFLLKDYQVADFITCVIRKGDDASPAYNTKLLYISPIWIKENAENIINPKPLGTGEYDYALLLITDPISSSIIKPEKFPYLDLEINSQNINKEINVLLASYPAELLGGISIQNNLFLVSSSGEIKEYFTFSQTEPQGIDLISVEGSIVSQQGSSGGAIVSQLTGKLIGMITTSSDGDNTADRVLRAITPYHINNAFLKEAGLDLKTFLSGNLEAIAKSFEENEAPLLSKLLIGILEGN